MAHDQQLAARVRAAMRDRDEVSERRMFGGLTFMVAGQMCCGVQGAELIVRLMPDRVDPALQRPHARPMDFAGRPMRDFVTVSPQGITGQALAPWVGMAVAAAEARAHRMTEAI